MAQGKGRQPYPVGYTREGFPKMIGWMELVRVSERSNTTVREMRDVFPREFPVPVTVTTATPVYLDDEVQEFFRNHPRVRANITPEIIRSIQAMIDDNIPRDRIARILDIHLSTVTRYANQTWI